MSNFANSILLPHHIFKLHFLQREYVRFSSDTLHCIVIKTIVVNMIRTGIKSFINTQVGVDIEGEAK